VIILEKPNGFAVKTAKISTGKGADRKDLTGNETSHWPVGPIELLILESKILEDSNFIFKSKVY